MSSDRRQAFRALRSSRPGGTLSPLASELAHGVLRHRSRLDWIICRLAGKKRESIAPAVLDILRLGVYQLVFTPSVPPYAAVSESVELAKQTSPKAAGFVNWVLRRVGPDVADLPRRRDIPDALRWLATCYSFPPWIVRRWVRRFGEQEAEELLAASNAFPGLDVRVNLLRSSPEDVAEELRAAGAEVSRGEWSPAALRVGGMREITAHPAFREGRLYIQDESSQLVALALAPHRGESILDACAGVGGKATHVSELTGDTARIAAVDVSGARLALLEENLRRLGHRGVKPTEGDILSADLPLEGPFDRVVLDAPCSSLGIIRRHPELKWVKRAGDIPRFAALQLRLLERVSALVKPGGTIAYSTCTMEPEENEDVVRRFLEVHREFFVDAPWQETRDRRRTAKPCGGGLERLVTPEGFVATYPHRHGVNGSFIARLRRRP